MGDEEGIDGGLLYKASVKAFFAVSQLSDSSSACRIDDLRLAACSCSARYSGLLAWCRSRHCSRSSSIRATGKLSTDGALDSITTAVIVLLTMSPLFSTPSFSPLLFKIGLRSLLLLLLLLTALLLLLVVVVVVVVILVVAAALLLLLLLLVVVVVVLLLVPVLLLLVLLLVLLLELLLTPFKNYILK